MDAIMKIIEGETEEEFSFDSIDHNKLKSFQEKCTIWDFNDITREEYTKKSFSEKQKLFYFTIICVKVCLFCVLLYCKTIVNFNWRSRL